MPKKTVSSESLKEFVRREGPIFLKQKNITSVGIGYKMTKGKTTGEISIQFTVDKKVAPEKIEGINATEIPKFINVDGVDIPTDVIQRNFEKGAAEVKPKSVAPRKIVVDPIVPGVSIGNINDKSAGTAGCVVYDSKTGTPYILSNWHVLNGPKGRIGDHIVQPGAYDDNRVDRNVVGKLERSYIGIAGDCAVASIENRRISPDIMGLNVPVTRIGDPDLGDRVVKSGRTTDVTYGLVKRIHVTVKMHYDEEGSKEIGCFEIGPDPKNPAKGGQISMGGDSGAIWLAIERNKPSDMMLGLHFAGEVGDAPDHALACYPSSVFEKLEIAPSKSAVQAISLEKANLGYDANFIGATVSLPKASNNNTGNDILSVNGDRVLDYMHFSLTMSKSRRFACWVAWNIDGNSLKKISRKGLNFKKDPDVPRDAQVGDELYKNNPLDKGHIARRADLTWGTASEAARANVESFFYTNITPQHEAFNQSKAYGIWGELEDAIYDNVDVDNLRISVIGGPIFSKNDPEYRGIQLPNQFWKVIYFREKGDSEVKAKGYILTQADLLNELEVLELPEFSVYETPLAKIGELTGLTLPAGSRPVGRGLREGVEMVEEEGIRRIASVAEIVG